MKIKLKNRKTLYLILSIVLVFVFTLTIVYAALNTVLKITGNAEVVASSWDIRLENPIVKNGSVNSNVPTITNNTTATFAATLSTPGDFYEFSIDVVNNGTIDAMIDSIEKIPELNSNQAKYLTYIIEYQNGENINIKQLVEAKSFIRLKVRVEYRKDLVSSDLPNTSVTLNLSFKLNYVQADENSISVVDSGLIKPKLVSGNYNTIGSEICIDTECFYVIGNDSNTVTMISKYNLYVGNECTSPYTSKCTLYKEPTGIQNKEMLGWVSNDSMINGTIAFSSTIYWYNGSLDPKYGSSYPAYVIDENSNIFNYILNYKTYLINQGTNIIDVRLIKVEELENLGCSRAQFSCASAPSWIYQTSYWTGDAADADSVWITRSDAALTRYYYYSVIAPGIRPVVIIPLSEL